MISVQLIVADAVDAHQAGLVRGLGTELGMEVFGAGNAWTIVAPTDLPQLAARLAMVVSSLTIHLTENGATNK